MFEGVLKRQKSCSFLETVTLEKSWPGQCLWKYSKQLAPLFTHPLRSSFNSHMMPNIWKASISVPGPLNLQAPEVLDQSLLHGHEMTSGEESRIITASYIPPCTLSTNSLGG